MTAHATGGGAIDLLLDAYEEADKVKPIKGRRFNLMHSNFRTRAPSSGPGSWG